MQAIIYRIKSSKVLPCGTGNYIQYPVITIMEKNMKKNVCVCVCNLSHLAVYQKLAQHCKSVIVQ